MQITVVDHPRDGLSCKKNATFPGFLSSNHIELDACQLRYANVRKDLFLLNLRLTAAAALLLTCIAFTASGCGNPSSVEVEQGETGGAPAAQNPGDPPAAAPSQPDDTVKQGGSSETGDAAKEPTKPPANLPPSGKGDDSSIRVIANPEDVAVLVNKTNKLPENYNPKDLVEPNVPFIFKEKSEKRMLRKEAASALEDLFDAAKKDGLPLAGVSGYRSHATQKKRFITTTSSAMEKRPRISTAPSRDTASTKPDLRSTSPEAAANARRRTALGIRRKPNGWPSMHRNTASLFVIRKARNRLPAISMSHGTCGMSGRMPPKKSPSRASRWRNTPTAGSRSPIRNKEVPLSPIRRAGLCLCFHAGRFCFGLLLLIGLVPFPLLMHRL